MSCDVGKALLILQPFRHFLNVTTHSSTLPLLHLRCPFCNPSFASRTSQVLHLIHLASRPWPVEERELSRIAAVQMKTLRSITKKTKRDLIRNERIRKELNQESVSVRLEEKQLKWFGQIT